MLWSDNSFNISEVLKLTYGMLRAVNSQSFVVEFDDGERFICRHETECQSRGAKFHDSKLFKRRLRET